ncbi:MAG: tRNA preQ1(34) S-adenosylmethionine ribosyltransferase-isomerase QueA [Proteobacteria bacterium]|nr:tRNA preQ1(34) S-adenosylmethionine ribosyltransferase-isomerase QueA [Pseudomonadota bacterium]
MFKSDFSYDLPPELIAQTPLPDRSASRLLDLSGELPVHRTIADLPQILRPGDLLVVNDTRVVKARLYGEKDSGGRAEILVERVMAESNRALCMVRVSKRLKPGRTVLVAGQPITVVACGAELYLLEFPTPVYAFLEQYGEVPLPPYIERPADRADEARYQTVYSRVPGAVAAPTAGLHFTQELFDALGATGVNKVAVTLHVGAGTFQPIRADDLAEHTMHMERYDIPEDSAQQIRQTQAAGGRIIAVGTTVLRTLEAASSDSDQLQAGAGSTNLFIQPGYCFRTVDALITNFHLPESTLLVLLAAFTGYDRIMAAYRLAVAERYRFFSYGDAMFVEHSNGV